MLITGYSRVFAAGGYTMPEVTVSGDNMRQNISASVTDSDKGILSVWLTPDTDNVGLYLWETKGFIDIDREADNSFRIQCENSAGTVILNADSTDTITVAGGRTHVLIAWDLATGTCQMYLDDAEQDDSGFLVSAGDIHWARTADSTILIEESGLDQYSGDIGDFYLNISETLDLSVEANRRKFIDASGNPVDLGTNATSPTGNQPEVCFSGDAAHWNAGDGKGSVTGWTVTGTFVDA